MRTIKRKLPSNSSSVYSPQKAERLEIRISTDQKELILHAANILHTSLTDFTIANLLEASKKVIHDHQLLKLSVADHKIFLAALQKPVAPNANLRNAAKRYKKEIKSSE